MGVWWGKWEVNVIPPHKKVKPTLTLLSSFSSLINSLIFNVSFNIVTQLIRDPFNNVTAHSTRCNMLHSLVPTISRD